MNRQQFIDALFARAKQAGFEACEVYYSTSDSFSVGVFKGEIIKYKASEALGLGFRGLYNGKMGYSSTQILDEEAIDLLIDGAKTNAILIENDDKQLLHPGSEAYAELAIYNPALNEISAADKIAMARELENLVLAADPRIEQVEACSVMSSEGEVAIVNTLGLKVSTRANMISGYVGPTARDGEKVSSGFASFFTLNPSDINLKAVAAEAAEKAVSGLNAVQVESGSMRVLFGPESAGDLLATFSGIFSADAAQKGLSLLKGREGERIAKLGDGLLITEVAGLHAGANAVSGDFSLSAKGFAVQNGQKTEPVKQITIAGNFFSLLTNIEAVGSDLKFGLPSSSQFGSPSILVKELSVAGK